VCYWLPPCFAFVFKDSNSWGYKNYFRSSYVENRLWNTGFGTHSVWETMILEHTYIELTEDGPSSFRSYIGNPVPNYTTSNNR
jgi:hypothetical protein